MARKTQPPSDVETLGAVKLTELGRLRLTDRPAWRAKILAALDAAGGNRTVAAEKCGVSIRQFLRYIREIGLAPAKSGPKPAEKTAKKSSVHATAAKKMQDHDTRVIGKTPKKQGGDR